MCRKFLYQFTKAGGHTYREPASDGHAEANQAQMELLRTGHHGQIMLMYYVNLYTFLEDPEKDWAKLLSEANPPPEEPQLFC